MLASGLLWGQQPPKQGPGAAGSADCHGLCVRPAVRRWLRRGAGVCKWFNVRVGFGFLSTTGECRGPADAPVDVSAHMEGFRSLKEGEAVEFTFNKSAKGLESIRVTGPGGVFCIGRERRPKGKKMQKCRSKGDRCYN